MNNSTNIGENLFPSLGLNKGYDDWLIIENRHLRNEFIQKFTSSNFISIVGKSGQGKSFFLRNHVIPLLKEGFSKNGTDKWKVIEITKTSFPLTRLCDELAKLAKEYAHEERVNPNLEAEFYELMQNKPLALVDILQDFFSKEPFNLLILSDKMDELFGKPLIKDELAQKERTIFCQQIAKAVNQRAYPINFVCSIDEKYVPKLADNEEIYSLITKNTFYFRPYESEDILLYLNKITENFFVDVHESVVSELMNFYSDGSIVLAQLIQVLYASYTAFLNDEKAEATIDQSHYKTAGSVSTVFDKSFKKSFNALSEDDKTLFSQIVSLLFYKDEQEYLFAKAAKISDLSYLLGVPSAKISSLLVAIRVNNQSMFILENAELVESRLELLSEENEQNTAINSSEIYVRSAILTNHNTYLSKTVTLYEQNVQKLIEISKDVYHREAYYRDEKQLKVYLWFNDLWFTSQIGKSLIENYEEVVHFINESYAEEERRTNRKKAEEQSRLAKERRFRILVISSAVLAIVFVVIAIRAASYLDDKLSETKAIEDSLAIKTLSLNKIQSKADSALKRVDILTEEFKSKEIETRKKSQELESAKKNIQVQKDSLFFIEQSLADNLVRQNMMIKEQDSLKREAQELVELANTAKAEAAFTSAINRINSLVFAGGQLIRNRNPLDVKALVNAVQLGLNAYDSLSTLRQQPFAMMVDPTRFVKTEMDLYSHLSISYSQLNTSALNNVFRPLKQGRNLSYTGTNSKNVFIGTNTGEMLRVDVKELKTVTENTRVDRQPIPIDNAQVRFSLDINDGKNTIIVLSDGRIVLFDFFYGIVLDLFNDENVGKLHTTSPIYTTSDNTYLTLFKGSILEFTITDAKKIKRINLSKIGESTDNWLKFSFDHTSNLAYVREDVKAVSVYAKSRITGVFEKIEQKYFDELSSDISYVQSIEGSNRIVLGLQNGGLATITTTDEGKKLDRSSLNTDIIDVHDNAILTMSIDNQKSRLATAGTDSRILIWNINQLFSSVRPIAYEREIFDIQAVHSAKFIDNSYLITASSAFKFDEANRDGQVVLWPLNVDDLAGKVLQLMNVNSIEPDNKIQLEEMK